MLKLLQRTAQVVGSLLLLVLLAGAMRLVLLPIPVALWAGVWTPPAAQLDARQVTRTEYYRGFFRPGRTFDQARSRAILAQLQDSTNFGGDTTPNFTQLLVYYDADGHVLGYTDLDLFTDELRGAATEPGCCGGVLAAHQLLRLLGYQPPFTTAHLRRQH